MKQELVGAGRKCRNSGQTGFMPEKIWRGYWWLPSSANDKIPGRLVVAEDGACQLELVGGLDMAPPDSTNLSDRVPVIHGEAEGKTVTLLDCFTVRRDGWGGRPIQYQDVHVHEALIGAHVAEDAPVFQSAIVTFEHLTSWLAIHDTVERTTEHDTQTASLRTAADQSCTVDGWTFTARTLVQPFHTSMERSRLSVEAEAAAYLVIRPPAPVPAAEFHEPVLEIMDLLTLASGEASGQVELTLIHKETIPHRDADGSIFPLDWRVDSYGARTHTARPRDEAVKDWRFLFTCNDRPFDELLPAWLALRRRAPEACNVHFGQRYARPTYTEVRLLLSAITAETLHASLYVNETELPENEFVELRRRVLEAIPDLEHQRWAKQKLRNSPSFRERLVSLAAKPDPAALSLVVPDVDRWSRQLRVARNNLAHTGNERTDDDIFHLERVTAAVIALVLMSELELPADVQHRAAKDILRPHR